MFGEGPSRRLVCVIHVVIIVYSRCYTDGCTRSVITELGLLTLLAMDAIRNASRPKLSAEYSDAKSALGCASAVHHRFYVNMDNNSIPNVYHS